MPLYRLLVSLFAIAALLQALRRGGLRLLAARLGAGFSAPQPQIWWHGASNGELTSARPILEGILAARPDLGVLVTCNSATGVALVNSWSLPRVTARPAPVDLGWVTRRVMRRAQCVALVSLESEIWPQRFVLCPGPVLLLGARMSAGTARGWARVPRLARRVLGRVALACAQDRESGKRLAELGLSDRAQGPVVDLKAFYQPGPAHPPEHALRDAFPRASSWLAASTHPGEEQIVLDAHRTALASEPDLRLIFAPRHATRGPEVAKLAQLSGFTTALRSREQEPTQAQVYIADTMGEMPLWYQLAGRVFVGGSLVNRGGHTPYEPARFGAALIHGPDMANQKAAVQRLTSAGAAVEVRDAEDLAAALEALRGPARQDQMGALARTCLQPQTDLADLIAKVLAELPKP